MKTYSNNNSFEKQSTIIVFADCMKGALEAGRFAVQKLLGTEAKLLLMQTFHKPKFGQHQLRDMSPMLKKIAREELSIIRDELLVEHGLHEDLIDIEVVEGQLPNLLLSDFFKRENQFFVIGLGDDSAKRNFPCRRTLNAVLKSENRPVIIVSKEITFIDKENIIRFSASSTESNHHLDSFLENFQQSHNLKIINMESERLDSVFFPSDTEKHSKVIKGKFSVVSERV